MTARLIELKTTYQPISVLVEAALGSKNATIKNLNDVDKLLKGQKILLPGTYDVLTRTTVSENDKGKPYIDKVEYLVNDSVINLLTNYLDSLEGQSVV